MPISQDLLDILACPACKTPVTLEGEELVCRVQGKKWCMICTRPACYVESLPLPVFLKKGI